MNSVNYVGPEMSDLFARHQLLQIQLLAYKIIIFKNHVEKLFEFVAKNGRNSFELSEIRSWDLSPSLHWGTLLFSSGWIQQLKKSRMKRGSIAKVTAMKTIRKNREYPSHTIWICSSQTNKGVRVGMLYPHAQLLWDLSSSQINNPWE